MSTGWYTAIKDNQGLLFATFTPSQRLMPPPEIPHTENTEAFLFCPEGLSSQDLHQPVLQNIQSWFIDLQTGFVFPFPPHPKHKTWDWLLTYIHAEDPSNPRSPDTLLEATRVSSKELPKFTPWVTYVLIALNLIVFILMTLAGGSTREDILILFGAKVNELILQGQFWRFFTSMFIHIGFFHLAFNLYALWVLGTFCEERFRHRRFLIIYILSGIAGSIASFLFTDALSAGASGAIFGILGALVPYAWKHPRLWKSGLGKNLIVIILINLGLGMIQPQIDIYAHLGGLIFGLAYGFLFP